jgi:hypothetical protein
MVTVIKSYGGRIQSEEMITIKWSQDFLLEIFGIDEQFVAGELNQSGDRYRYLYKIYILAHVGYEQFL